MGSARSEIALWLTLVSSLGGVAFLAHRVWRIEKQQDQALLSGPSDAAVVVPPRRESRRVGPVDPSNPKNELSENEMPQHDSDTRDVGDDPEVREEDEVLKRANRLLAQMSEQDLADYWDQTFQSERAEPEWSRAAIEVRVELEGLLPDGAQLTDYECRASLCRIELTYTDKYLHNQFVHDIFDDPDSKANSLFGGFMTNSVDEDVHGGARMTGYLVKQGRLMVPQ